MSYEAEGVLIQQRFAARWVNDASPPAALTLIAWENTPFKTPGSDATAPPKQDWVRIQIMGTGARVASVGGPNVWHRHDGDVVIEVFTAPNKGPSAARELADTACGIFRGWKTGGLVFWSPRVMDVGTRDGWYRKNVICPFQRDTAFAHQ